MARGDFRNSGEGRPSITAGAGCHMPRRYVGLGIAARGTSLLVIVGYDHAFGQ